MEERDMMFSVDYTKELRAAYQAGATAGMLFAKHPKKYSAPDADNYIERLRARPPVVRA